MSKFWEASFHSVTTELVPSTANHPQTGGLSEITNREAQEVIRASSNYKKHGCDDRLVDFEFAYNSAVNSTTLRSPFLQLWSLIENDPNRCRDFKQSLRKVIFLLL